jgi:hypothetical protein
VGLLEMDGEVDMERVVEREREAVPLLVTRKGVLVPLPVTVPLCEGERVMVALLE